MQKHYLTKPESFLHMEIETTRQFREIGRKNQENVKIMYIYRLNLAECFVHLKNRHKETVLRD